MSGHNLNHLGVSLRSFVDYALTASSLDEMSTRIDDLEKNIGDLMTQAGVEEIEAATEKAKEGQVS